MKFYHAIDEFENTGLVQAVTSIRQGGVSRTPYHSLNLGDHVGDNPEAVLANRRIFFDQIGLDTPNFAYCRQVHGNRVLLIDASTLQLQLPLPEADAMVTVQSSLALGVFTADCVPIFVLDVATPAIGIAHAGWRGTLAKIATQTINSMENHFGSSPSSCLVHLGPSIQKCCYTTSVSLADQFERTFGSHVRVGECTLDLPTANVHQFLQMGVPSRAVSVAQFCTACCTDLFYSHRLADGKTGRMLSLIRLL